MTAFLMAAAVLLVATALWVGSAPHRVRPSPLLMHGRQLVQRVAISVKRRWRRRTRQAQERQAIARFALALADELDAGLPLTLAITRAAGDGEYLVHTANAAISGGDVADALNRDAERTDSATLRGLAAAWQVAAGSGAGLSRAARSLGEAALERERIRRDLAGHLAAPRGTARILALLPVFGLLLGSGFGGSPLTWLLGTPIGLVVLAAGVVLETVGILWVRQLVRRVEKHL